MTFKGDVAADVTNVFLNTDEYAQDLTYRKVGVPGGKAIKGVPEDLPDSPSSELRNYYISSDATEGIADPRRGDKITDPGGKEFTVRNTSLDELGMYQLECEVLIEEG